MRSSILSSSRARRSLVVAAGLAFVAIATAQRASAQKRSEIGSLGCTVRAAARAHDTEADVGTARDADRNRRRKRPVFSVREVLDLEFHARIRSSSTTSPRIQLKLYTPTGHLYQALPMSFGDQDGDRDEDETPDRSRRRFRVATAILPMAGTTIVNHALYGKWKAVAFVEGNQEPCSPPLHFVIDP